MSEASEDDELIPISALQHFAFCDRQCALIHIDRIWYENELTAEGRVVHERADLPGLSGHGRVVRASQLRSDRLGLVGRADVVEFIPSLEPGGPDTPFPVEYKRGRSKGRLPDRVQLCAQAIALEEMTGLPVAQGALFYHSSRRRVVVEIDQALREETENVAAQVRALFEAGVTPKAELQPKCSGCSLWDACQPAPAGATDSVRYVDKLLFVSGDEEEKA